jgi:hypothetical protein
MDKFQNIILLSKIKIKKRVPSIDFIFRKYKLISVCWGQCGTGREKRKILITIKAS